MKTCVQFALLAVALFCGAGLHAGEYNIPSRETVAPSAEDVALAKLISAKESCSCPATGICSCAVCDCPDGAKLKVPATLVAGRGRSSGAGASCAGGQCSAGGCSAGACAGGTCASYPDTIVQNGVTLYRVGSAAARAVGIPDPASIPVFTLANGRADLHPFWGWQMTGRELQSAQAYSFSSFGGGCSGGSCGSGGCSGGSCGGGFRGRR